MLKTTSSKIIWAVIFCFAIYPIIYFLMRFSDPVFRDSAMGNWFATMIGAFAGILIALEINRYQEKETEKKEGRLRGLEEKERKEKILNLTKKELEINLSAINERRISDGGMIKRVVSTGRLKDETWNAFSDGGELQWIKDLYLLDSISTAYYNVRIIIFLEEKYFEVVHFPGIKVHKDKSDEDSILEYLLDADIQALKSIKEAIEELEKNISLLNKN